MITKGEIIRVAILAAVLIGVWAWQMVRLYRSSKALRKMLAEVMDNFGKGPNYPDDCEFSGNCDQECESCSLGGLKEGYK